MYVPRLIQFLQPDSFRANEPSLDISSSAVRTLAAIVNCWRMKQRIACSRCSIPTRQYLLVLIWNADDKLYETEFGWTATNKDAVWSPFDVDLSFFQWTFLSVLQSWVRCFTGGYGDGLTLVKMSHLHSLNYLLYAVAWGKVRPRRKSKWSRTRPSLVLL